MNLDKVKNALLSVSDCVYHYEAFKQNAPFIVWAEDGQGDCVWADGEMQEQVVSGTVDLFTKTENDPLFHLIQAALSMAGLSWSWNSTQLEEDTGLIHYEWTWEFG